MKRWLLSPKTVLALISAVGASCLVAALVPQLAQRPPAFFEAWRARRPILSRLVEVLKLNQVFSSGWFLVLVALVAASLALSLYHEVKAIVRASRGEPKAPARIPFQGCVDVATAARPESVAGGRLEARLREIFARRRYRPRRVDRTGHLVFTKNRAGRWSSVVFHAGILATILAALYGLAFQKRGFVQLAEAESFDGRGGGLRAKSLGVLASDFDLGFRVSLERFTPTYWDTGAVRNMESVLVLTDESGERRQVPVSLHGAAEFRGVRLYQSEYFGTVAADGSHQLGRDPRHSPARYWTGLTLAADHGIPGVYFGFALATLGAIMIFLVPYKEIHVEVTEGEGGIHLTIGGRAKSDQAIFAEELADLTGDVRAAMAREP